MSNGKNALFKRNPSNFLANHTLMVSPDGHGPAQKIPSPVAEIDLSPLVGPKNPESVMLLNYLKVEGKREGQSISAYYLPANVDNTSTLRIGVGKPYMFTPDLSGCLFAAYGPNANDLTVEHVNVRTIAAVVSIPVRAVAILNGGYPYCKIITPVPITVPVGTAQVANYNTGGNVVGVLTDNGWVFHYRVDQNAPAIL